MNTTDLIRADWNILSDIQFIASIFQCMKNAIKIYKYNKI